MVLTPSRYLNWFHSYSFLNFDMSKFFTNINHDDVRRHDSTVHYIFYDDVCRHDSSKLVNKQEKYIPTWTTIQLDFDIYNGAICTCSAGYLILKGSTPSILGFLFTS